MISEKILVSNRCHLEANLKRVKEVLASSDDGTFRKGDEGYERGDAFNLKQVARQNHRATKELCEDIIAALKRMDDGIYGICVDCGNEINEDRLTALPHVSTCVSCRKKRGLRVK
ncbi:MAG: TraR/DksA C4-type zinc finger protein [bacterium]|nr:TraR/DksA C4-type zinc finger protein [bacterium]